MCRCRELCEATFGTSSEAIVLFHRASSPFQQGATVQFRPCDGMDQQVGKCFM